VWCFYSCIIIYILGLFCQLPFPHFKIKDNFTIIFSHWLEPVRFSSGLGKTAVVVGLGGGKWHIHYLEIVPALLCSVQTLPVV
jgi:hypothetical protein